MTTKKDSMPAWMPRQQPLTDKQARLFLYALMRLGNVSAAAKHAKANRTALYQRRARDDEFAAYWAEALSYGVSHLEDKAFDVALNGWLEPVYHEGEECGQKQRFSPALMIFLLKSHDPGKYRERVDVDLGGKGGGPLSLQVTMDPRAVAEVQQ